LIEKSSTKFDDYLVANNAFVYLSRLVLLVVAKNLLPAILIDFQAWIGAGQKLLDVLLVLNWYLLFRALLRSVRDHLRTQPSFQDKPLGSYLQVANIVLVFVVAIVLFTLLTGNDPWKFLGAFGAASAIVMLVFKDTILGFVASIQVSV